MERPGPRRERKTTGRPGVAVQVSCLALARPGEYATAAYGRRTKGGRAHATAAGGSQADLSGGTAALRATTRPPLIEEVRASKSSAGGGARAG